jgi:hypothetical protein
MLSKEIVEEFFVKTKLYDSQGKLCPLPPKAEIILEEFKNSWLKEKLPDDQTAVVSVSPEILSDGAEGYSIRKVIVYESQTSAPPLNIQ